MDRFGQRVCLCVCEVTYVSQRNYTATSIFISYKQMENNVRDTYTSIYIERGKEKIGTLNKHSHAVFSKITR